MYQPTLTHPQEFLSLLTSSNGYCGSTEDSAIPPPPPHSSTTAMFENDLSPHEPSTRSPTPAPLPPQQQQPQPQHQHYSAAPSAPLSCCWPAMTTPTSTNGSVIASGATPHSNAETSTAAAIQATEVDTSSHGMFSMEPDYATGFGQDLFSMTMYLPDDSTTSSNSSGAGTTTTTTTTTATTTATTAAAAAAAATTDPLAAASYINDIYYRRHSLDMYNQQQQQQQHYRPQAATMAVPPMPPSSMYTHINNGSSARAPLQNHPTAEFAADLKRRHPDGSPPLVATSTNNKRARKLTGVMDNHQQQGSDHLLQQQQQQQPTDGVNDSYPGMHQYDSSSTASGSTTHPLRQTPPGATPRRQKLRYDGDEYTPKWVRYTGQLKEGYCDHCKPGKWLQLKNSAYWYHKQFYHGISSVSGKHFAEPLERRAGDHDVIEGLCHQCRQFVPICNAKRKTSVLWYRHAHKCHIYDKPKSRLATGKRGPLKK